MIFVYIILYLGNLINAKTDVDTAQMTRDEKLGNQLLQRTLNSAFMKVHTLFAERRKREILDYIYKRSPKKHLSASDQFEEEQKYHLIIPHNYTVNGSPYAVDVGRVESNIEKLLSRPPTLGYVGPTNMNTPDINVEQGTQQSQSGPNGLPEIEEHANGMESPHGEIESDQHNTGMAHEDIPNGHLNNMEHSHESTREESCCPNGHHSKCCPNEQFEENYDVKETSPHECCMKGYHGICCPNDNKEMGMSHGLNEDGEHNCCMGASKNPCCSDAKYNGEYHEHMSENTEISHNSNPYDYNGNKLDQPRVSDQSHEATHESPTTKEPMDSAETSHTIHEHESNSNEAYAQEPHSNVNKLLEDAAHMHMESNELKAKALELDNKAERLHANAELSAVHSENTELPTNEERSSDAKDSSHDEYTNHEPTTTDEHTLGTRKEQSSPNPEFEEEYTNHKPSIINEHTSTNTEEHMPTTNTFHHEDVHHELSAANEESKPSNNDAHHIDLHHDSGNHHDSAEPTEVKEFTPDSSNAPVTISEEHENNPNVGEAHRHDTGIHCNHCYHLTPKITYSIDNESGGSFLPANQKTGDSVDSSVMEHDTPEFHEKGDQVQLQPPSDLTDDRYKSGNHGMGPERGGSAAGRPVATKQNKECANHDVPPLPPMGPPKYAPDPPIHKENTGYPLYHVPQTSDEASIPDLHKPCPPGFGCNPYEVLTSSALNGTVYTTDQFPCGGPPIQNTESHGSYNEKPASPPFITHAMPPNNIPAPHHDEKPPMHNHPMPYHGETSPIYNTPVAPILHHDENQMIHNPPITTMSHNDVSMPLHNPPMGTMPSPAMPVMQRPPDNFSPTPSPPIHHPQKYIVTLKNIHPNDFAFSNAQKAQKKSIRKSKEYMKKKKKIKKIERQNKSKKYIKHVLKNKIRKIKLKNDKHIRLKERKRHKRRIHGRKKIISQRAHVRMEFLGEESDKGSLVDDNQNTKGLILSLSGKQGESIPREGGAPQPMPEGYRGYGPNRGGHKVDHTPTGQKNSLQKDKSESKEIGSGESADDFPQLVKTGMNTDASIKVIDSKIGNNSGDHIGVLNPQDEIAAKVTAPSPEEEIKGVDPQEEREFTGALPSQKEKTVKVISALPEREESTVNVTGVLSPQEERNVKFSGTLPPQKEKNVQVTGTLPTQEGSHVQVTGALPSQGEKTERLTSALLAAHDEKNEKLMNGVSVHENENKRLTNELSANEGENKRLRGELSAQIEKNKKLTNALHSVQAEDNARVGTAQRSAQEENNGRLTGTLESQPRLNNFVIIADATSQQQQKVKEDNKSPPQILPQQKMQEGTPSNTGYAISNITHGEAERFIPEYHKPLPPLYGVNPYEVLTSSELNGSPYKTEPYVTGKHPVSSRQDLIPIQKDHVSVRNASFAQIQQLKNRKKIEKLKKSLQKTNKRKKRSTRNKNSSRKRERRKHLKYAS